MNRFITIALPLLLAGCARHTDSDETTAKAAAQPRAVTVAKVENGYISDVTSVSGVLVPREEAAVFSQIAGYPVAAVYVDQDDEVKAGQPLALLDDRLLLADIEQQRAAVEQQTVAAEKAAQEAARVSDLAGSGVLSQEAIAERALGARAAKASVAQAQAQLNALLLRQQLMTIRSPVSGRILERQARPGDIASTSNLMFRIARDNLVELDAEIPEQIIDTLHAGQSATVALASGITVTGKIRLVSAQIDAQTKLGRARILLPPRGDLRPGGFATAKLQVAGAIEPSVPQSALRYDASGAEIMVLDASNRAHSLTVRTGSVANGRVALIDGPSPGTRVLTGGQSFVLDGDTVRPVVAP